LFNYNFRAFFLVKFGVRHACDLAFTGHANFATQKVQVIF